MDVTDAVKSRFSARSFLSKPVAKQLVTEILRQAGQAPSGANMQPWKVHVISGAPMQQLVGAALESMRRGVSETPEYPMYPTPLPDPFRSRRFETGMGLYKALGIERSDQEARNIQLLENFRFFGAPVGMIFTIDKMFVPGQLGDLGMFIQNVMLLARQYGLALLPTRGVANGQSDCSPCVGHPGSGFDLLRAGPWICRRRPSSQFVSAATHSCRILHPIRRF